MTVLKTLLFDQSTVVSSQLSSVGRNPLCSACAVTNNRVGCVVYLSCDHDAALSENEVQRGKTWYLWGSGPVFWPSGPAASHFSLAGLQGDSVLRVPLYTSCHLILLCRNPQCTILSLLALFPCSFFCRAKLNIGCSGHFVVLFTCHYIWKLPFVLFLF